MFKGLRDDRSNPGHVLLGGVGAAANETILNFQRPAVLLGGCALLKKWWSYEYNIIKPKKSIKKVTKIGCFLNWRKSCTHFKKCILYLRTIQVEGDNYQLSNWCGQVRCERSIYVRLKGGQVDLDQLIIFTTTIRRQQNLKHIYTSF